MKLKGAWESDATYDVGDVVTYEGLVYQLDKPCKAGISPQDTLYWNQKDQHISEAVLLIMDAVGMVMSAVNDLAAEVPENINDEAITLKSGDDEYLITVDASGDEPELAVTKIEEEAEA